MKLDWNQLDADTPIFLIDRNISLDISGYDMIKFAMIAETGPIPLQTKYTSDNASADIPAEIAPGVYSICVRAIVGESDNRKESKNVVFTVQLPPLYDIEPTEGIIISKSDETTLSALIPKRDQTMLCADENGSLIQKQVVDGSVVSRNITEEIDELKKDSGNHVDLTSAQTISGEKTFASDVRLKGSSNYGRKLRFGDGDYVYIFENADDHLEIRGDKGINFKIGPAKPLQVNGSSGSEGEVLTSNGSGAPPTWKKVDTSNCVTLTDNQKITGVKTFASNLTVGNETNAVNLSPSSVYVLKNGAIREILFPDKSGTFALLSDTEIPDGSIGGSKLASSAVSSAKLGSSAVTSAKIASGAVTETKLGSSAVTSGKIASGAVTETRLADGAVTSGKLADGSVTGEKIADLSVTETKLADGAVTSGKLADNSVTGEKIADLSVTETKLADGAVTSGKLADNSVAGAKIANLSITETKLGSNAVTSAKIASGAVTSAKLGSGSVTSTKLGSGSVTGEKIASGAVTETKLSNEAVTTDKIADKAVTENKLSANLMSKINSLSEGQGSQVVDDYLDAYSTNPVTNRAITQIINIIETKIPDYMVITKSDTTEDNAPPEASGWPSLAIGYNSFSLGEKSLAIGNNNLAREFTVAIGYENLAENDNFFGNPIAIGFGNKAIDGSIVLGSDSAGEASHSIVIGSECNTTAYYQDGMEIFEGSTIAIGRNCTADGVAAINIGSQSNVKGTNSLALGMECESTADNTITIGQSAKTTDESGIAIGYETSAGFFSVSMGRSANSPNKKSVSLGCISETSADEAIALGCYASATDEGAIAIGSSAKAGGIYSTAIGVLAQTSKADVSTLQLGNTHLATLRCKASLTVTSDERDKTDIVPIDTAKALRFINQIEPIQYVDNDRDKYLLREFKTNDKGEKISDEDGKNEKLFQKYGMCDYDREAHSRGDKKGERKRVGVKAQQIAKLLSDIYETDNYANLVNDNLYDVKAEGENPPVENKLTVAYDRFVPFLISAIQEQQKQIDALKREVSLLKGEL